MGAFTPQYEFPISVPGDMLTTYRTELAAWTGLSCLPERPATMPKRLLTLREDGGPDSGTGLGLWGYGVNVWADSRTDAKGIAVDAMSVTLTFPGEGQVKRILNMVGVREVEDDPQYTYNGKPLHHFYFSFDALVKAL